MQQLPNWNSVINSSCHIKQIDSLLDYEEFTPHIKCPIDILALSVFCYKNRIKNVTNGHSILELFGYVKNKKEYIDPIFQQVSQEDIHEALVIRDYYSKKIMMWNLLGKDLSEFRKDLSKFIHTPGTKVEERMSKLIYRLPEFYNYDKDLEKLKEESNQNPEYYLPFTNDVKILSLIKQMDIKSRGNSKREYWFKDQNECLVQFILNHTNSLFSFWNEFVKKTLVIQGNYYPSHKYDVHHFEASNIKPFVA